MCVPAAAPAAPEAERDLKGAVASGGVQRNRAIISLP
jgi:hypothetical protein